MMTSIIIHIAANTDLTECYKECSMSIKLITYFNKQNKVVVERDLSVPVAVFLLHT